MVNRLLLSAKSSHVPVEVATVYAYNDPVGWREAAVELEFPLDILILAVGHHSLPPPMHNNAPGLGATRKESTA